MQTSKVRQLLLGQVSTPSLAPAASCQKAFASVNQSRPIISCLTSNQLPIKDGHSSSGNITGVEQTPLDSPERILPYHSARVDGRAVRERIPTARVAVKEWLEAKHSASR